jgi:hypothetical protein
MAKFIRYALATVCFAMSVGCLALWWRSLTYRDRAQGPIVASWVLNLASFHGIAEVGWGRDDIGQIATAGWVRATPATDRLEFDLLNKKNQGVFGYSEEFGTIFFPHWYPAVTFALAGIGILRFRRQFSIRSALIYVSVVAVLLGMAVAL